MEEKEIAGVEQASSNLPESNKSNTPTHTMPERVKDLLKLEDMDKHQKGHSADDAGE